MTDPRPVGRPRVIERRVTVGLPADLLADLNAEAADRGLDRSEVIRERLARLAWTRNPPPSRTWR